MGCAGEKKKKNVREEFARKLNACTVGVGGWGWVVLINLPWLVNILIKDWDVAVKEVEEGGHMACCAAVCGMPAGDAPRDSRPPVPVYAVSRTAA